MCCPLLLLQEVNAIRKTPLRSPYGILSWVSSGGDAVYYFLTQLQVGRGRGVGVVGGRCHLTLHGAAAGGEAEVAAPPRGAPQRPCRGGGRGRQEVAARGALGDRGEGVGVAVGGRQSWLVVYEVANSGG